MRQPETESPCDQHQDTGGRSLAARSAWVAWKLLRQDEQHCLLAEKTGYNRPFSQNGIFIPKLLAGALKSPHVRRKWLFFGQPIF
jgi:hypothetical protein